MKVRFRFNHWLPRKVGAEAITIYPFIFFARNEERSLAAGTVAHELVHVIQVRRLGWLGMYARYLWEFAKLRIVKGYHHWQAHEHHSMEKEARKAEVECRAFLDALYEVEKRYP